MISLPQQILFLSNMENNSKTKKLFMPVKKTLNFKISHFSLLLWNFFCLIINVYILQKKKSTRPKNLRIFLNKYRYCEKLSFPVQVTLWKARINGIASTGGENFHCFQWKVFCTCKEKNHDFLAFKDFIPYRYRR